jgi:hypothetical protein
MTIVLKCDVCKNENVRVLDIAYLERVDIDGESVIMGVCKYCDNWLTRMSIYYRDFEKLNTWNCDVCLKTDISSKNMRYIESIENNGRRTIMGMCSDCSKRLDKFLATIYGGTN